MLPTLPALDETVGFLREGYTFVSRRCDRLGTDGFRTRLLLQPIVCLRGADAARLFYAGDTFRRAGAFPTSVVHLLQDEGSVQALEGDAHRDRKHLFLHALQGEDPMDLPEIFEREWRAGINRWQRRRRIVLHDAMTEVLTRTATTWCGIPMTEHDVRLRTRELSSMVERAGSFGPTNWWARGLRRRSEQWAAELVTRVRSHRLRPPEESWLALVADHRDPDGEPLTPEVAAVELLNVLRPMVAVSRFVAFAALALLRHPQWHETFAAGDEHDLRGFVHEVRRFYPFFPVIGGRAMRDLTWEGRHEFREDDWVLLDLYGTNHDERLWENPQAFVPERFRDWAGDPNTLIPQGAGEYANDHRCPGEPMTIELMMQSVRLLTGAMSYTVPMQDLQVDLRRMPALPNDGFVMSGVRPAGA